MHTVEFLPGVMQRVMARQGKPLAFERFEAPGTALIVVDMQNYCLKPGMPTSIDTVLITGVATNLCCESTARDAMMLNFNTVMVSDGLAAKTDAMHNATLATFYMQFGDVQTTDQVNDGLAASNPSAAE